MAKIAIFDAPRNHFPETFHPFLQSNGPARKRGSIPLN
jgi:hypothetical protein